ncbi:endonuclease NucS domain-containing protein [Arthrobacter sp. YN]|uniref:endonuclease NucS domain-containing protein n=1 Tax=Arthrobacter sp. YN TaxID=2020486 RepID=UPI000B5FCF14|nr:endonuclease NucS domain-containing protein [Arthrobacter sp. YN]ASN19320.1 hypothetical protein CGK93_06165 [Arthrobacter sp. YN]
MDILAVSEDRKRLLVVELKRARAGDVVVGQIQRYMGYAQEALIEPGQSVEGVIIAQEDDLRIRRALTIAQNIRFMKYSSRVSFGGSESLHNITSSNNVPGPHHSWVRLQSHIRWR